MPAQLDWPQVKVNEMKLLSHDQGSKEEAYVSTSGLTARVFPQGWDRENCNF